MKNEDSSSGQGHQAHDSGKGINSEVLVAATIFLFLVILFVCFLYLYAKLHWGSSASSRRRARVIFAASDAPIPSRGLDAAVLGSLPITTFKCSDFKEGIECSICLNELSDREKVRLLPKCNHGFHLECIDMWFCSQSTCPVCRCPVGPEPDSATATAGETHSQGASISPSESSALPTNVLVWGNQDRFNTGRSPSLEENSERTLVISIPSRTAEWFPLPVSPLPASIFPVEEMKSPAEEARSKESSSKLMKSLMRLLSSGKRTVGSPCSSPVGADIEQGLVVPNGEGSSVNVPKTLRTS
ncbi:RING-H2 finger protein ATL3 [Apostasia shenzhenica]|uniref:RING-type E3 ubiquitin transferase n=1 Tax=Apostasia shenzhenica TaxID=1088818 RepID=A0A2H9ZUW9_9ASPA|nr:RING-H2 finger protein ATL3 [Apostasia shenzhenica]